MIPFKFSIKIFKILNVWGETINNIALKKKQNNSHLWGEREGNEIKERFIGALICVEFLKEVGRFMSFLYTFCGQNKTKHK